jgi:hypothetical protein
MHNVRKERFKTKNPFYFLQEDLIMRTPKLLLVCMLTSLLSAHVALGTPVNDDCANAQVVGIVTDLHFDTTQATFDGPAICTFVDGANIWYRHTPTCTGWITVSLCGSIYDTKLAVYRGTSCPPTVSRLIECNDDFCDKQSQITFWATSGTDYLIEVGGFANRKGQGLLTITTCGVVSPPPSNDDCDNASSIGTVTDMHFDTSSATFDGPGLYMTSPNIWYVLIAPCSGEVTVSLCGSGFDTRLAVYSGDNCPPTAGRMIAFSDCFCGQQSQVSFIATAGNRYLIEVGGWSPSDYGHGVISVHCGGAPPPPPPPPFEPANNNCFNATSIGNVTNLPFNTTNATFDGPGLYMTTRNIWYRYTATCTGEVTISLCGSSFDTKLAVYNGANCPPTAGRLIAYNDDHCSQQSEVTFSVTAGQQYLIEVGGWSQSDYGQGVLSINCIPGLPPPPFSPVNDNCANATTVGNVTNFPFDTTNATFDGPALYMTSPNVWFRYTATCTGSATISLCGSSFNTKLAVYNGGGCWPTASQLIGYNANYCGQQSQVTIQVVAGQQYLIEVGGWSQFDTGQGVLSISCSGAPFPPTNNDDCENATPVGNVTNMYFTTVGATFDGPGNCVTNRNIWYSYIAPCTGNVTVSLCGSSYDTVLAIHDSYDCHLTQNELVGCNDDFCGQYSQITFAATAGHRYLIEIGGYDSETGEGVLSISCGGVGPQLEESDLGDAPDSTNNLGPPMTAYPMGGPMGVQASYPTVFNDASGTGPHGPIHYNPQAVAHLGNNITRENEADIGADQDGLNNIDPLSNSPDRDGADDGVVFPLNLPHCRWTTFNYLVNVTNPGTDLWVNVWFDWNRDGDWDDTLTCPNGPAPEWAVQNRLLFGLPPGLQQLTTPAFMSWHPQFGSKQIWMRITLSEQPWTGGSDHGPIQASRRVTPCVRISMVME